MSTNSIGDRVVCHIKNSAIVSRYENEYDEKRIFDIIAIFEEGYFIYIPPDLHLKDTITVGRSNYQKYHILKKFIGDEVSHISDHKIASVYQKIDGLFCAHCGEFVSMAGPNQKDKSTFVCYPCRVNRFR